MNKYHAIKYKGFDSKLEAKRYEMLKAMEARGEISHLETQVPFELIPNQYEPETVDEKGKRKKGKLIERKCTYIADFMYLDKDGRLVVEDAKGLERPEYIIKRKLMLYFFNIRVQQYTRTTR